MPQLACGCITNDQGHIVTLRQKCDEKIAKASRNQGVNLPKRSSSQHSRTSRRTAAYESLDPDDPGFPF